MESQEQTIISLPASIRHACLPKANARPDYAMEHVAVRSNAAGEPVVIGSDGYILAVASATIHVGEPGTSIPAGVLAGNGKVTIASDDGVFWKSRKPARTAKLQGASQYPKLAPLKPDTGLPILPVSLDADDLHRLAKAISSDGKAGRVTLFIPLDGNGGAADRVPVGVMASIGGTGLIMAERPDKEDSTAAWREAVGKLWPVEA